MTAGRRFPAPWTVEEHRGISYIVRDANDFAVAYVYFESEPGRRAAAKLMTKDEARKIAARILRWRYRPSIDVRIRPTPKTFPG
jgi:hypothetical protein